jgi:hypothetical protein
MKTNSPMQRIAVPIRIFMTALLVLFAVVFVQMCIIEIAPVLWTRRPAAPAPTEEKELSPAQQRTQRIRHARKEFLPDGTLHLVTQIGGPKWRPQYTPDPPTTQEQIYDVNDKLLWDGPIKDRPYDYLAWAQGIRSDTFKTRDMHRVQTVDPDMLILEFPVTIGEELLEKWRYNPWHDCFVGYSLTGEQLGYLSTAGTTDSKSQVRPFGPFGSFLAWWPPEAHSPMALWQTKRRLYQINFDRQKIELIFESLDGNIADIRVCRWDSYRPKRSMATAQDRQLLHCRTRDGVYHVIRRDPNQSVTVRVPDEWKQWMGIYCQFAATEQDLFLRRDWTEYPARPAYADSKWRTEYLRATKTWRAELYRVSETGALDLVNAYRWTIPGEDRGYAEYRDPRSYVQPYVTALSPLAYDLAWAALGRWAGTSEWWREGGQLLYELRPRYRVGGWLVTAMMLTLTFLHARARYTSKAAFVFWLIFVGLLNLTGFLVYWALNHTAVITCSTCAKHRGLGQTDCVRCGAPLPAPEHGKLDLVFGV